MKKLNSILFWAGVIFLTYLVWTIGPRELFRELRALGWGLVPFLFAEGAAEMIHTIGWRHCLSPAHRSISWWHLFRMRMSGYAVNYLTPTASMGGEITRMALLASQHRGPEAVTGVIIEKVAFASAQVLFVASGCLFLVQPGSLPLAVWILMLLSSAVIVGGIITFVLLQKYGKLGALIRWLDSRNHTGRALQAAAVNITRVDEALRAFYRDRPRDICLAIGWHLVGCSLGVIQTWLFFHLLDQDRSLLLSATVWTLAMWFDLITFMIPLSVGSLEGSRIVTFRAVGSSPLAGLTYGVAVRLSQLTWAGIGLLLYGSLTAREQRRAGINRRQINEACSSQFPQGQGIL